MKKRVALGMSGGVDSSVAAKLLLDQGYEVVGFFMKLWHDPTCEISRENACCDEKAQMDARTVADSLGIKFFVVDARSEFKDAVVEYFINEYKALRTPNPCVVCNEKIKFDWLLKYSQKLDCDFLATGHYAKIVQDEKSGIFHLLKGEDKNKDQSYFLYRLNQDQLSKVLFPVGNYIKSEIKEMAKKWNLPVFEKKESQEICFIANGTYRDFLRRYLPENYFKSGDIVDESGYIIGHHDGLINYTIGQRKGIAQNTSSKGRDTKPMYVTSFDQEKNRLVVGEKESLLKSEMIVKNLYVIDFKSRIDNLSSPKIAVKIRYRAQEIGCKVLDQDNQLKVILDESQQAIAPGQSAVFYLGDEVIGGGVID